MNIELFKARGGGRVKFSPSGALLNATWPFCRLAMNDDNIEYKLIWKKVTFAYTDIEEIRVSRLGYIWFNIKGESASVAFTGRGISRIIEVLQSKSVRIADKELQKLGFATSFVNAQIMFGMIFLTVWLGGIGLFFYQLLNLQAK